MAHNPSRSASAVVDVVSVSLEWAQSKGQVIVSRALSYRIVVRRSRVSPMANGRRALPAAERRPRPGLQYDNTHRSDRPQPSARGKMHAISGPTGRVELNRRSVPLAPNRATFIAAGLWAEPKLSRVAAAILRRSGLSVRTPGGGGVIEAMLAIRDKLFSSMIGRLCASRGPTNRNENGL